MREYERELTNSGEDKEADDALAVMLAELKELLQQIQELRVEMKENTARQKAALVKEYVSAPSSAGEGLARGGRAADTDDEDAEDCEGAEAGM